MGWIVLGLRIVPHNLYLGAALWVKIGFNPAENPDFQLDEPVNQEDDFEQPITEEDNLEQPTTEEDNLEQPANQEDQLEEPQNEEEVVSPTDEGSLR
jgi:hypothetical protein